MRVLAAGMESLLVACLVIALMPTRCPAIEKNETAPKSEMEKINYSIGYQLGGDFRSQGWGLEPELLVRGIRDAISQTEPLMSPDEMRATLITLKRKLVADQRKQGQQAGADFLATNAKKEGVVALPSGVQYKVIKTGTGKQPNPDGIVTVRYKVIRVEGQEIPDTSPDGEAKTYPLKKALPGLQEVLMLMKEGSVWQIVIPPGSSLGSQGEALENAGVLVYVLELVSVQTGKADQAK